MYSGLRQSTRSLPTISCAGAPRISQQAAQPVALPAGRARVPAPPSSWLAPGWLPRSLAVQLQHVVGAQRGALVIAKRHQQHAARAHHGGGKHHALGDLRSGRQCGSGSCAVQAPCLMQACQQARLSSGTSMQAA